MTYIQVSLQKFKFSWGYSSNKTYHITSFLGKNLATPLIQTEFQKGIPNSDLYRTVWLTDFTPEQIASLQKSDPVAYIEIAPDNTRRVITVDMYNSLPADNQPVAPPQQPQAS